MKKCKRCKTVISRVESLRFAGFCGECFGEVLAEITKGLGKLKK